MNITIKRDKQAGKVYYHRTPDGTVHIDKPDTDFFKNYSATEIKTRIDAINRAIKENTEFKTDCIVTGCNISRANDLLAVSKNFYEFVLHDNKPEIDERITRGRQFRKWNDELYAADFKAGTNKMFFRFQRKTVLGKVDGSYGLYIEFNDEKKRYNFRISTCYLARYDTPAQVETVIERLKAAIERGDREFTFPTVEELTKPEVDKSATADSLTRAMTIALESYQAFCRVGNLTAATNELSLYNICRKAMSELLRREAA